MSLPHFSFDPYKVKINYRMSKMEDIISKLNLDIVKVNWIDVLSRSNVSDVKTIFRRDVIRIVKIGKILSDIK